MHSTLPPLVRIALLALLASPLLLALVPLHGDDASPIAPAHPADGPRPTTPAPLPSPVLGFAVNAHHISEMPLYLESVDEIADMGANTLIIVTPMYQRKVNSTAIRQRWNKCPTDQQLSQLLTRGRERGLSTILMPIVLLEKPKDKEWRGVLRPKDWDKWWTSYDRMMDRFINLAVANDATMLVIGSELNTTEDQLDRWQLVADRVRDRYSGLLGYSSNWDRYDKTDIWPIVDVMCISSYFELERDRPGAPEDDLVAAWDEPRQALLDVAAEWDMPMILSEIGYPSVPWANAHPWNYVADDDVVPDHELQARCWRAFFRAWHATLTDPESPMRGFCGYRWDPYRRGGDADRGYGIRGKPAYQAVADGIAEVRRVTDAPTDESPSTSPAPTTAPSSN